MSATSIRYEDAAERMTVTGFACKTCRRWWGEDEHMARWCCATDLPCECGGRKRKSYTVCEACREKAAAERFAAKPRQQWDGKTPLYSETLQRYFFDDGYSLREAIEEAGGDPDALRLFICRPRYAHPLEDEYWHDDMPPDEDLESVAPDLFRAISALNEVIETRRAARQPLSWEPSEVVAALGPELTP